MANAKNNRDQVERYIAAKLTRHDFPADFLFGAATSCYQVEGGYADGGKSLNNWDVFSLQRPEKIMGGVNGCVAINHYNRFDEDVALMKKLGLDTYRFSISWSRILPAGRLSGGINQEGVKFYNDLINALISQGIEPCVTLFHFDYPQSLQEEYGGFLSPLIVDDFAEYAEVCFFQFGDRVKLWVTENEPWTFTNSGYVAGNFPPARGSNSAQSSGSEPASHRCPLGVDQTCHGGDAGTEPYIVAHHLLLAHGRAVEIYRKNFQAVQGGKIGVTNMTTWFEPYSNSQQDIDAAARAVDFMWGWFVAPIVTGDYPPVMRERVKERLPKFTPEESNMLKGSYDFIGMNYYTTNWAAYSPNPIGAPTTYRTDQEVQTYSERDGKPIGRQAGSPWLFVVPHGIYDLLMHTKNKYNDPIIYITENGVDEKNDPSLTITKARRDPERISYHVEHLAYMKLALDQGVRLKGYYPWSLFDNYEWAEGYSVRFGFYLVDFMHGLTRYPKDSAIWYMNFLNKNIVPGPKRLVTEEAEDNNGAVKKRKAR